MNRHFQLAILGLAVAALASGSLSAVAAVLTYGDADVLNTDAIYPGDPTAGATLEGLALDAVTFGAAPFGHSFPFAPSGDFPGTDQIYVGSAQTASHDGYSSAAERIAGPQGITLDYSSLVPAGHTVTSLTLGIAADDFQFPPIGNPFSAGINGGVATKLAEVLNTVDQTTPVVQFFTIGISPAVLLPTHVLSLSIDQGGDGGDGWAIDFLTVGVTTIPEPGTLLLAGCGWLSVLAMRRRHQR